MSNDLQATDNELAELLEHLSGRLRWYLFLGAFVTILVVVDAIRGDTQLSWLVALPIAIWSSLLLAARRVHTHYSVGAAVFLAVLPCLLAVIALFLFPQQGRRELVDWICLVLFVLTFGLQGARCVVLVGRLRRAKWVQTV